MEIKPATVKLIYNAFDRDHSVDSPLPYRIQKDALPEGGVSCPLERSTPEAEGVSTALIADFLREVSKDPIINMHSLMIVKNGKVICEARKAGYEAEDWHQTYSMCKTVTGLAIGLLYDEGKIDLDAPIRSFFPDKKRSFVQRLRRDVTVRHLLTMTSGYDFAEAGVTVSTDWISDFFSSSEKFEAGEKFQYNSMNSYMLAVILRIITGETLCDYLRPRLFEPLGIRDYYWETAPDGTEKGGYGLYLHTEDMAKLGLLLLNGGAYGEKQLISKEWVREMTEPQASPSGNNQKFDYGFQIWVSKDPTVYLFNGLFGQNITCLKDAGIVIASCAGSDVAFHEGPYFALLDKYFFHPARTYELSADRKIRRSLRTAVTDFYRAYNPIWQKKLHPVVAYVKLRKLRGRVFRPTRPEPALGILPKIIQMVQNNYPTGISSLSLSLYRDTLLIRFTESGRILDIPFGLRTPVRSILNFRGEKYAVSGSAKLSLDDSRNPVAVLRLDFVETVSSRTIRIVSDGPELRISMKEEPGIALLGIYADSFADAIRVRPIIGSLAERVDVVDFIKNRIRNAMMPEFTAVESPEAGAKREDIKKGEPQK